MLNEQLTDIIIQHSIKNQMSLFDAVLHIAEEMDIDIVDFVKQLDQTILDMVALESIKDRRIRQSLIDKQPLQLDI